MSLQQRLDRQLRSTRQLSEKLLADFKTPQEWVHQVHPGCNHALWFAGHMANTDNFLLSLVSPSSTLPLDGWSSRFGMGSQPTDHPAEYPPPETVLATMRERRAELLQVLSQLSEEDLAKKTPAGAPEFLPDLASVFELAIWHEGLHAGQLSVTRRALGHQPLVGAPAGGTE
jgi:uncharacterized damage-inducible protein DinB